METQYFRSQHPVIQLLMFVLIAVISVLAFTLISLVAGILIFQVSPGDWVNLLDMTIPDNLPVLKFLQVTQSLSLFVIPPLVFGWFATRHPWAYLHIDTKPDTKQVAMVLVLAVLILPVINLLSMFNLELKLPGFLSEVEDWMKRSEKQAGDLTEAFLAVSTFGGYVVNVLMVALIPGFGEEFFFRGVLQKIFHRWFRNPHVAIIVVSIIFSAFHMQFYGFLPRFGLGVLFGYLFWWSGNIWYPVLAHFMNNFLPVTLAFFFPTQFNAAGLDTLGVGTDAWLWAVPSFVLSLTVVLIFYRNCRIPVRPDIYPNQKL